MQNISNLFDLWPSDAELGRDLGVSYSTVAAWKQRGSIPAMYWRDLIRAAWRRGHSEITADALVDVHARKPAAPALTGFAEEDVAPLAVPANEPSASNRKGHFSRFKHLRRSNFQTAQEIEDHVRALRDEWAHR